MVQVAEAEFHQGEIDLVRIDYRPSGVSVAWGEVVLLANGIGICTSTEGIADGALGNLDVSHGNVYRLKKASGTVFTQGVAVGWDDTANLAVTGAGDGHAGFVANVGDGNGGESGDDFVTVQINVGTLP